VVTGWQHWKCEARFSSCQAFCGTLHGSDRVCRCFLLMGEFVRDARRYVLKRPRIELLARDVIAQCALLSEVRQP